MRARAALFAALVATAWAGPAEARKPPRALAWAFEALEGREPEEKAPAVVLLDEAEVHVLANSGRLRYHRRRVVRIREAEGRELAFQPIFYGQNSSLSSFHAWTIRPDGSFEEFDRSRMVDVSLSDTAVYSDARVAVLPLRNVGVGSAIALDYVLDEDRFFLQGGWEFQGSLPVAVSRYVLNLPSGWTHDARVLNHEPMEPRTDGDRVIWELRDLPRLPPEPYAPPVQDVAARLVVTFLPRGDWRGAEAFRSWPEVAAWYHGLVQESAETDGELRAAVARLVDGVEDPLERIRAIGRYVQDLRYVSIGLGVSAYRPRSSPEVLRNRFADCKDKATLMLAMLREAGIDSYPVLVDSRDRGRVFEDFPSPLQFNHCILAIPAPPATAPDALVIHPDMGKILVFDPTDELTPLGDLPWTDQATHALLIHPEAGRLLHLPALPPEASRAERQWEIELHARTPAHVSLRATYTGQYARLLRARYTGLDAAALQNEVAGALGARAPGVRLTALRFDGLADGAAPLQMEAEAEVKDFARRAGPLLLAEPFRLLGSLAPELPAEERRLPLQFSFRFIERDSVHLGLPQGYRVSEEPADSSRDSALGRFSIGHERTDGGWELRRMFQLDQVALPAEEYEAARGFLDAAARATAAPLVLESDGD